MEKDIDYEQLYYDAMYENRKLKDKITELEKQYLILMWVM